MKHPDRPWYNTASGRKWHLMATQVRGEFDDGYSLCGIVVNWQTRSKEATISRSDLCVTCERLGK